MDGSGRSGVPKSGRQKGGPGRALSCQRLGGVPAFSSVSFPARCYPPQYHRVHGVGRRRRGINARGRPVAPQHHSLIVLDLDEQAIYHSDPRMVYFVAPHPRPQTHGYIRRCDTTVPSLRTKYFRSVYTHLTEHPLAPIASCCPTSAVRWSHRQAPFGVVTMFPGWCISTRPQAGHYRQLSWRRHSVPAHREGCIVCASDGPAD